MGLHLAGIRVLTCFSLERSAFSSAYTIRLTSLSKNSISSLANHRYYMEEDVTYCILAANARHRREGMPVLLALSHLRPPSPAGEILGIF